jgi:hypothetical protein
MSDTNTVMNTVNKLRAEGLTYGSIARTLNRDGITTIRGQKWKRPYLQAFAYKANLQTQGCTTIVPLANSAPVTASESINLFLRRMREVTGSNLPVDTKKYFINILVKADLLNE